MTIDEYIFLYGTLRETAKAEQRQLITRDCKFVSNGTIQGRLYEVDGYPGAVESTKPGEHVIGELYRILAPQALFPQLDEYEECSEHYPQPHEYVRKKIRVSTEGGQPIKAWVYLYNLDVSALSQIDSGDYLNVLK